MQYMTNKVLIQTKGQLFNRKGDIFIINLLAQFKRVLGSSLIPNGAAVTGNRQAVTTVYD